MLRKLQFPHCAPHTGPMPLPSSGCLFLFPHSFTDTQGRGGSPPLMRPGELWNKAYPPLTSPGLPLALAQECEDHGEP